MVCTYSIEVAKQGFLLSHKHLKEHVDEIMQHCIPSFPGVGLNYPQCFVDAHHNELAVYSAQSLDGLQGGAVNPTSCSAWFYLLGEVVEEHDIAIDMTFNVDKTGIQPSLASNERGIGPQGRSILLQT